MMTDLTKLSVDKRVEQLPFAVRGKAENLERDLLLPLFFPMNPPALFPMKWSDDGAMKLLMLEATTMVQNKKVGLGRLRKSNAD